MEKHSLNEQERKEHLAQLVMLYGILVDMIMKK